MLQNSKRNKSCAHHAPPRDAIAFAAEPLEQRALLSAAGLVTFHPTTRPNAIAAATAPVVKALSAPTANGLPVNEVDLQISASPTFNATAGEFVDNIPYSYTLSNNSDTETATNVSVSFNFTTPLGVVFDSSTPDANDSYSGDASSGTWNVASIAPHSSAVLNLVFTAESDVADGSEFFSDAQVDSADQDLTNTADDFDESSTFIDRQSDFDLSMSVDEPTPVVGHLVTYTIDLSNFGPSDSDGVQVTDLLPVGLTFDSADTRGFGTYDDATGIWDIGTVTTSDTPELLLTAKVDDDVADTTITNTADVTSSDSFDESPASASADIDPEDGDAAPDVTVALDDGVDAVEPGDKITWVDTATNSGDGDASGITISEVLPLGTTFKQSDNPGWTQVGTSTTYTFTIASLASGDSASASFVVHVTNPAASNQSTIVNNVAVNGPGVDADNTASDTDALDAAPDGKLTITDSGATFPPGATILYSVTYSNHGNQNTGTSSIAIAVPAHTTFDAADSDPAWINRGTFYQYDIDHINAGDAPKTIIFAVKVDAALPAAVTQTTIAGSLITGRDANLADNDASVQSSLGTPVQGQGSAILTTDPCDPSKTAVIATGTSGDDKITFIKANNKISVKINNQAFGPFSPTGSLIAYGLGGADTITGPSSGTFTLFAFGGAGKDTIIGGAGFSVIVGGDDADTLTASDRRSILIGGLGADKITGGLSDDILIGGVTAYDTNINALCEIRDEWFRTDKNYSRRVGHVSGTDPDGKNVPFFLMTPSTVIDEGAADTLKGKGGSDLFFTTKSSPKKIADDTDDKTSSETRIVLASAVANN